ncbi:hypothetical protein AMTR_s00015p00030790 [Amborella trichopoda]|uniref:Uncharacterized protein n=1 Tax=Amborella trichopoda TaxID=13333 RepID=W1PLC1_AMBTC|nr:hypothetical protein AMTR_s00015p00030790 [Amborella trichopoda]
MQQSKACHQTQDVALLHPRHTRRIAHIHRENDAGTAGQKRHPAKGTPLPTLLTHSRGGI